MGLRQRKGKWMIDFYDSEGERHYETVGTSLKLAKQMLERRRTEVLLGKYELPQRSQVIFEDAVEKYMQWSRQHKRSWRDDEGIFRRLDNDFNGLPLVRITPWHVEKLKHQLTKGGASGSRVNRYLATLSGLYHRMKDWGLYTGENPVKAVSKFRENPGRIRYLTPEEINRLLEFCNDELKAVVTMALQTGMRQGEILRLGWSDVDMSNRIIRVSDSKNGTRRDIPMCERLFIILAEKKLKATSEYVFAHDGDKPHTTGMRTAWKRASRKAGLDGVRFHDLRHTFASHLVMNGANLFAVQQLMGHKSLDMTRRYSHLAPGALRSAVLTMDSVMGERIDGASEESLRGKMGANA